MRVFLGVAKISILFGVLEIPDFFFFFFFFFWGGGGQTVDAWPEPTNEEKIRVPPPPTTFNTPMIDWCDAQLQLHKIIGT